MKRIFEWDEFETEDEQEDKFNLSFEGIIPERRGAGQGDCDGLRREDGGMALIASFWKDDGNESGIHVNLISWDESLAHEDMHKIMKRKVRITIETID